MGGAYSETISLLVDLGDDDIAPVNESDLLTLREGLGVGSLQQDSG